MPRIPIWIVDDSEIDRYVLRRYLEKTGLEVSISTKENGREAIVFFEEYEKNVLALPEEFPPALIFLDINMPLLNGHEFLAAYSDLREQNPSIKTIVVMHSSSGSDQDKAKVEKYDFVKGYLVKGSLKLDELKETTLGALGGIDSKQH